MSIETQISNLKKALEEQSSENTINEIEDYISRNIAIASKQSLLYDLPINAICSIIQRSDFSEMKDSFEIISTIITSAIKNHKDEAILLLNSFKKNNLPILQTNDCINILSHFNSSDICIELGELYNSDINMPERDWEYELNERNKQIEALQNELNEMKKSQEQNKQTQELQEQKENKSSSSKNDVKVEKEKNRVCVLGDSFVGKTGITTQLSAQHFITKYNKTIGAAYQTADYPIKGKSYRLAIWDTAGDERYFSLLPLYTRSANVALIVYSITDRASFDSVGKYIKMLKESAPDDIIKIIIGNKKDQEKERKVSKKEGEQLARQFGAQFIEISATNTKEVNKIGFGITEKIYADEIDPTSDKKDCRI